MTRQSTVASDSDEIIECNSLDILAPEGLFLNSDPIVPAFNLDIIVMLDADGTQLVGSFGFASQIGGFSIARDSTGVYSVFDMEGPDHAVISIGAMCVLATCQTANRRCEITDIDGTSFKVRTFNATTNAAADSRFTAVMYAFVVT